MIPEKVFHQILALGEAWRVRQVEYVEKESKVLIQVEETPKLWAAESCPHCPSKSVGGYDHAPERRWRHLNVCQLNSEIVCALPRGRCRQCQKVYTVRAPWEGRMRLELQRAYAAGTAGQARDQFQSWCRWVRTEAQAAAAELLEPMRKVADMVERHLEGILEHWKEGLTTAFLEGLNSLFSATKHKARGYRSTEYQVAMLYFVAGKLEIPYYS